MSIQKYIKFCTLDLQRCSRCKCYKPYDNFWKSKHYCKPCVRETDRKYYAKKKEKILEKQRQYYEKNSEKMLLRQKEWRDNNKDKVRESNRRWYGKKLDIINEQRRIEADEFLQWMEDNNIPWQNQHEARDEYEALKHISQI